MHAILLNCVRRGWTCKMRMYHHVKAELNTFKCAWTAQIILSSVIQKKVTNLRNTALPKIPRRGLSANHSICSHHLIMFSALGGRTVAAPSLAERQTMFLKWAQWLWNHLISLQKDAEFKPPFNTHTHTHKIALLFTQLLSPCLSVFFPSSNLSR